MIKESSKNLQKTMPTIKTQLFLALRRQGLNIENSGCITSYKHVRENLFQVTYILANGHKGSTFVGKIVHELKAKATTLVVRDHLTALEKSFSDITIADLDTFYLEARVSLIDLENTLRRHTLGTIAYNRQNETWEVTRQDGRVTTTKSNSFSAIVWLRKEHESAQKTYQIVSKTLQNRLKAQSANA